MDFDKKSLEMHKKWRGKLQITSKVSVANAYDLSVAYTPGVAAPCLAIEQNPELSFVLTSRWNTIAVVTDGTAVLGLGDIGPLAAMPVMEGKCVLFKEFGNIDAVPICINSKDTEEIIRTVCLIAGSFGGINLEDISAPRCFEIERRLIELLDIPIFHDDQHGTAVVTLAALKNALKITGKKISEISVTVAGAGAAGVAVVKLLMAAGLENAVLCDREGAIYEGRNHLNPEKQDIARFTNRQKIKGTLADAMRGADVFIGLSVPNTVTGDMVKNMAKNAILFPMANPIPEILPAEAKAAGAAIIGTGRSDFENQINNVLAFPGILRGALDTRAKDINTEMKLSAANALADLVPENELSPNFIIPAPFDKRVGQAVAAAVVEAAVKSGVARSENG